MGAVGGGIGGGVGLLVLASLGTAAYLWLKGIGPFKRRQHTIQANEADNTSPRQIWDINLAETENDHGLGVLSI